MSEQHTPEPWHECAEGDCQCGQILGPDSIHITTVKDPNTRRRIVACVNRLAGISTEDLENPALAILNGEPTSELVLLRMEVKELSQQRDELLAFLREIESVTPQDKALWIHTVKCKASALIAKAKEGE